MADEPLTQDFDAHVPFSFTAVPESPWVANRSARVARWSSIAFTESWLAVLLFRLKKRLRAAGVPVLPALCDLASRALFRVQIGNAVEAGPGLMITHGNVVIDGRVTIGRDCSINPWVTIGLSNSKRFGFSADGPTIGDHVHIGTGAKVLGPVRVGNYVRIGANAVVVDDVPANTTVVGAPARPVIVREPPLRGEEAALHHLNTTIVEYRLHRCSIETLLDAAESALRGETLLPVRARVASAIHSLRHASNGAEPDHEHVADLLDTLDSALISHDGHAGVAP